MSRKELPQDHKASKRHIDSEFQRNGKLKEKRALSFLDSLDLDEEEEEREARIAKSQAVNFWERHERTNPNEQVREGQTYDMYRHEDHGTEETECAICQQSQFEQGKYILECKHILCNDCYKYWSAVTIECPVCSKKATTVLAILHNSTRTIKVNTDSHIPICVKCHNSNNYHQLYFCDECEKTCVHTYCERDLLREKNKEHWLCEECICKMNSKNHYAEESPSEEECEGDVGDFIVPDHAIEWQSEISGSMDIDRPSRKRKVVPAKSRVVNLKKDNMKKSRDGAGHRR